MGLFRQAYVQRSYGMVPLCCSKAPLSTFALVNNHSSLFLQSLKAQDDNIHIQYWKLTFHPVFCSKTNQKEQANVTALVEAEK